MTESTTLEDVPPDDFTHASQGLQEYFSGKVNGLAQKLEKVSSYFDRIAKEEAYVGINTIKDALERAGYETATRSDLRTSAQTIRDVCLHPENALRAELGKVSRVLRYLGTNLHSAA